VTANARRRMIIAMHILFALMVVAAAPPVAQVADAEAIAWLELPQANASAEALAQSRFADLFEAVFPKRMLRALKGATKSQVLAAAFKSASPGEAEATVWIEAGKAEPAITAALVDWLGAMGAKQASRSAGGLTLTPVQLRGRVITVFSGQGRSGWSTQVQRAERALTRSPAPLDDDPAYVQLLRRTTKADARGRINVPRLWGMVARSQQASKWIPMIERLGLEHLAAVEVQSRLLDKTSVALEVQLTLPRPWRHLLASLGPPIAHTEPAVPKGARYARASVRPGYLWSWLERMASDKAPMETALVRAQLDGIEKRLGSKLVEDALGEDPQVWTVYQKAGAVVVEMGVKDATLMGEFVKAYAAILPNLFPQTQVKDTTIGKTQVIGVSGGGVGPISVAVLGDVLLVSSSAMELEAHLGRRQPVKEGPLGSERLIAYGNNPDTKIQVPPLWHAVDVGVVGWRVSAESDRLIVDATVRK